MKKKEFIIEDLVSVIVPCYNMSNKIGRLIPSLLNQTYKTLEIIFVNDGSTDDTAEKILAYERAFVNQGMKFILVNQENKGLAGAINAGLKVFTGEYFCWPDADDYLEPESIELRVQAFKEHPEVGVVTSDAYLRDSSDIQVVTGRIADHYPHSSEKEQFHLLLDEKSIFCPGCHLVKTKAFLDVNPNRYIYPARRGQNWQLLLPIYYKYSRYFLNKPLYDYINYVDSMSKNKNNLDNLIERYQEHERIITETLGMIEDVQSVNLTDEKEFIIKKTAKNCLGSAFKYKNVKIFNTYYRILKEYDGVTAQILIKKILIYIRGLGGRL